MLYDAAYIALLERGLRTCLPDWDLPGDAPVRLLAVSENATFLLERPEAPLVFRVQRPGYNSEAEILSELAWVAALRADGAVHAPAPVPCRSGAALSRFAADGTEMLVTAFEYFPGVPPDETGDLVQWFGALGGVTARLHLHARAWTPPAGFARRTWDWDSCIGPDADWGDWRIAPGLGREGIALLERAVLRLRAITDAYGRAPDRWGLIHSDMKPGNLLAQEDRLAVIDFDDCGQGWFMVDFAGSVSALEADPRYGECLAAWLDGYRRVAPLAAEHEAMIPAFVMLRRIQLSAWAATHSETPFGQVAGGGFAQDTLALAERFLSQHA
ncbi:phosphotransferase enzyme family protein [Mangrovicoccus sp. HB161399]|uniref:phosphotransferase enzyme family protein n=1 Tax=Mangrovicoccus sp. HB161399 TaxID=2720392 RepID=UPI001556DD35|nr:phosphotransferase [Mangrovicoccus sp. HB161399]